MNNSWKIILTYFLYFCKLVNSSGVIPRDDGSFEVLDWDEYERGSRTFTFVLTVAARSRECFYEHLLEESKIFLSFEVLTTSSRTMDYYFEHEKGRFISKFGFKSDTLQVSINETSEWKFCFANVFDDEKELYVYGSFYHPYSIGPTPEERNKTKTAKSEIQEKSQILMRSLEKIEEQSIKMQQITAQTQSHEIVDTISQSTTQYFILKWATFQLIIVIGVGLGQVYLIRHWFNILDHERIHKNRNIL